MTNKQYFKLENLKHEYNQKLKNAQEPTMNRKQHTFQVL